MLKLKQYLKPYIALLLGAVILLFGQAMLELTLPNYMSDIVNVGLQQGGITYASPEATCTMTETLVADGYYPTYRGIYPDGTARPQAEFEKNEDRWWLDDYYTK